MHATIQHPNTDQDRMRTHDAMSHLQLSRSRVQQLRAERLLLPAGYGHVTRQSVLDYNRARHDPIMLEQLRTRNAAEPCMTYLEAAEHLTVTPARVRQLIRENKLIHRDPGTVTSESVHRYAQQRKPKP